MSAYAYDEAQYAAEYYALDADVGAACLELAPQLGGAGVALGDLDELCAALRHPVRDDRERAQLMVRLDPENAMRIDRAAVTTWLLEELFAASQRLLADQQASAMAPRVPATPTWEEIVEPPSSGEGGGSPSVYYYNTLTGETDWALAHPFATCLYKHLLEVTEIRALKAAPDTDGFLDIKEDGEMVDDLQRMFAKFDDDRDGRLDANEFRDLCVALAFPLGLSDGETALTATMRAVDLRGDHDITAGVTWGALLDFWTVHVPWQRRTRLATAPYDQWERLERLDKRAQPPWFRHVTTLRERWSPPSADQAVVDLLMKLFPSTKLEWRQRVNMLWELQLQPSGQHDAELPARWTLRECRALLDQLGWDHFTRREHVESCVRNLQKQYGSGEAGSAVVLSLETLAAWMLDCVARVEMDGWEECVDESSAQRYYCHEVLGLTQWDPPQLEDRMAKMMARFSSGSGGRDDQIQRIFRHYDEDESGSISFREFKRLYVALLGRKEAVSSESETDDAQIQQVFSVLDTSGDDEVSVDEFMVWWKTKMSIEDEETEQQRQARVLGERRRIVIEFLKHHDALIVRPIDGAITATAAAVAEEAGDEDTRRVVYLFESNVLARLVAVLGKYPLKGIAYRDALTQLVHATRVVDQEILLEDFLAWYVAFDANEKEKEELAAQKARALALLEAKKAEVTEKARKLKMIRKGQLITKAIASADATKGGSAPEPAELVWKRHVETLFRKFDKDNSGFLDAAELKELTNALGHALSDAQVKQMMAIMDSSGDERISVDEFVTFWTAFQRRKRANESSSPTKTKARDKQTNGEEQAHRREAISMVDASANLAVSMELAKERALKLSVNDVKDALGDWKESLLDRSRKKKLAKELAEQQRARLEALKKEWASFVPTKKSRYAHLDVTWIEPEVVRCVVDMIETVRTRARPLPREDAAQRIQRVMRGGVTRMRLFAMVLARFPAYVDLETGFFYYVDTHDHGRVWLHRPLFHTITSPIAPWDLADCQTKVERLRFRHRQLEMQAKQRFHHKFIRAADSDRTTGALFVPASFVVFTVLESVRLRVLGNIWYALRDKSFVLAELVARHHWRQLTQRSNSDASAPLPLHHVVKHHRETPFRLIQAIYEGHPDAVRERDAYGRTPLHLALHERAGFRVVELLLSRQSRLVEPPTRSVAKPLSVWEMQSLLGETPLHVALRYGVSLELLRWICRHKSLLRLPDHAPIQIRNKHGHAVFHLVMSTLFDTATASYWRSVVLVLLQTWPRRVLCSDASAAGDLPLHLAIERCVNILNQRAMPAATKMTPPEDDKDSWLWLIRLLVAAYPDALLVKRKHDALLAIHLLVRARVVPESLVLETLQATILMWRSQLPDQAIQSDEEQDGLVDLLTLRETKTTFLHYALLHRSSRESLLLTLLEQVPSACHVQMQPQHELPLHLAARHGAPVAVVTRLCEIYGAGCLERNRKQELPLHLAVQSSMACEDTIRVLLHYCPFVLSDPSERRGLAALVMAANVRTPNAGVLRALLDHTPPQKLAAIAQRRSPVTPLYAISLRNCNDTKLATSGILDEMEAKFEAIEDDDAYFTAMAKAMRRRQHHCPTASWPFPTILDLLEKNPVDEAIIQRALLALDDKLTRMIHHEDVPTASKQDPADGDRLGVVVETVTLNREWMLVRRIHQTLYELPWNARVQLLGQKLLVKLLPSAFAKAAYKSRVDPYFNL